MNSAWHAGAEVGVSATHGRGQAVRFEDEYSEFYRIEFPRVVRTSYLILHDRQRAEEVAQEEFIQLLTHCYWLFGGYDTVKAGGGDDFVESSAGANSLSGGPGKDMVAYLDGKDFEHQHAAVTVDLGSGTSSSGDSLRGFEDVLGSVYGDTLIGDAGTNAFYGYTGDDVLRGREGDDKLIGMGGKDEAYGGPGIDRCRAETTVSCELGG